MYLYKNRASKRNFMGVGFQSPVVVVGGESRGQNEGQRAQRDEIIEPQRFFFDG